jgi:hypothetical protein
MMSKLRDGRDERLTSSEEKDKKRDLFILKGEIQRWNFLEINCPI